MAPSDPFARTRFALLLWGMVALGARSTANCTSDYTVVVSPPPTNGTYACGQSVTFCVTITGWNINNNNWFHAVVPTFGPGWDLSTLTPGPPPATAGGSGGTWGWYDSVTGTSTAGANAGPQGPGFFFDLDNDGDPGDNFGDYDTNGPWEFCWTISVLSAPDCVTGTSLDVAIRTFSDSQTGSWDTGGCGNALLTTLPATIAGCPSAGNDDALSICGNGTATDLFPLLGPAAAGGTWTGPGGIPFSGTYDPAVNASGTYTYAIAASPGCLADQAVITVNEQPPANAGGDGSLTVCSTGVPTDLFLSLIGATGGGTWTGPGGVPFSGIYDPAVHAPGLYTYTVAGAAPCANDQATVTVTENTAPSAGADAALSICSDQAPLALLPLLGSAQAGGTWTDPNGMPFNGTYDPAIHASGAYTYIVVGIAPCPADQATVMVAEAQAPDAGDDGALTVCAQGAATSLFDALTNADAGGTWTAPGGGAHGAFYVPATDAPGTYIYTITGAPPCANDQAVVVVDETTTPNAGNDGTLALCASSAAVPLFGALTGANAGGTWTGPDGMPHADVIDPATDPAGTYTYTMAAAEPCPADQAEVVVTIDAPPNAGADGALTVCTQGAPADLFAQLNGATAGGSWTAPGGIPHGPSYNPEIDAPGTYTYTLNGPASCPPDEALVVVSETATPNAGNDGAITLCSTSAATDLFAQLTGADAGGTWSDPSGAPHGPSIDPGVDPAGVYTYTIAPVAPCIGDAAQVTVTINTPPNAGDDGALILCAQGAPADLFAQLNGATVGGSWIDPSGAPHGPTFDPATDAVGIYTYTLSGTAPCPADQATVTVALTASPNAGNDGAIILCSTSATTDLFAQLTGADAGGSWTDPSGAPHAPSVDPGVDPAGVYTYTIAPVAPCTGDAAQVTVAINTPPNAGDDGALILCAQGAPADLFAQLNGATVGGSWTDPSGAPHGPTFDPATDAVGVYTYILNGTAPCPADQATVTVALTATPNAGNDGTITLCSTSAAADLFAQLTGADAGGSWTDPSGALHGPSIDPGMDPAGVYTYTIAPVAPCAGDAAQVVVTINTPPNAGDDGALTLCAQGAPTDLFAQLNGATVGGSWTDPSGAPHGPTFDPAIDAVGIYTYTLNGTAPCPADQATVTVALTATPNAGDDGAITLCSISAATDLFAQLTGADAGGSWADPGGTPHGPSIDPSMDPAGVYTYTIAPVAPCAGDAAQVVVTINTPPNAGDDGALTLCAQGAPADLFAQLNGATTGGSWTDPSGAPHGPTFDPATDAVGIYTYTLSGTAPCPADQATVTVALTATPDAGNDGAITLCSTTATTDLFAQLTGADAGGSWTDPNGDPHGPSIYPSVDPAGVYTYTIAPIAPCAGDAAQVMVTINAPPNAGVDALLSVCDQGGVADLFAQLAGADEGGTWTGPDGLPHSVIHDPTVDGSGVYTYVVAGLAPCPNDVATVTVTEVSEPDAGNDGLLTLCDSDGPADLFASLGGTPDGGGTWTGPDGLPHAAILDPSVDALGEYGYTVSAQQPCASANSRVTVMIQALPDAGTDGSLSLCLSAGAVDLFTALQGTPQPGGTWTDPNGAVVSGSFDPQSDLPGDHLYTVAGMVPCPSQAAVVHVDVVAAPDAGEDASRVLCTNSDAIFLPDALNGSPDAGGAWTAPDGGMIGDLLDPATAGSGTYRYVVAGDAPCVNDTALLAITIHLLPTDGLSEALAVCATDAPFDPFMVFGGTAQGSGNWSDPSGSAMASLIDPAGAPSGVYTYLIPGQAPCPNGVNTLALQVDAPYSAGGDGALVLCASGAPAALADALGGSPDDNGTWTDPNGAVVPGSIAPADALSGAYTYTVPEQGACPGDAAVVNVMVHVPPDAGTDAAMTWCENNAPTDLLSWLGGTPQATGTWTDPYGAPFDGPLDPATAAAGAYTYTVQGVAPCPSASAVLLVAIDQLPEPGTDAAIALCPEAPAVALLPLLGTPVTSGGAWSDPSGAPIDGTFDPATMPAGPYTYTLQGTGACTGTVMTSTVNTSIRDSPSPSFLADTTIGCIPLTVTFHALDGSIATVIWDLGSGGVPGGPVLTHTFPGAGAYSVEAAVTDTNGCTASFLAEDLIFVQPAPTAGFTADPDPTSTHDPDITFTPEHLGYPVYAWSIDGDVASAGAPWTHRFPDAIGGTYTVCLTVTDTVGCTATYCDPVVVRDALSVHVPNAFTPDGDGVNDGFSPMLVGADAAHYDLYIFDRWGMMVFESHTPGEAWTGARGNQGPVLPEDVYVWRLRVGDAFSTDRKEMLGHVTLLK